MKPSKSIALVAAALFFGVLPLYAFDLTVENATGFDIHRIHAFSQEATDIGTNLLDRTLIVGGLRRITVPETTDRLLAVDEEGDDYLVLGLGPRERTRIILSLDDLFSGDPLGRGRPREMTLTLLNETGFDLVSVVIRPVAQGTGETGVELLPPAQRVAPGRSLLLRPPEEYSDDNIFHVTVLDAEGDLYEKRRVDFQRELSLHFTVDDIRW
ncbi:MAG: hypothetical protein ACOCW6_01500 [Spirochaetota bacterium]